MARIPTVTAEKSIDTAPTTIARLYTYDESSRSLQGLGSTVENIAARLQRQNEDAENFATEQKFQQHADNMAQSLDEATRNAPPGAFGLADSYTTRVLDENKKFLDSGAVPDRLRERVSARLDTLQTRLTNKASDNQYKARVDWYKQEFTANAGRLGAEITNDPDSFLQAREKQFGDIDRSNLPAVDKMQLKTRHGILLTDAAIDGLVKQGRNDEARELASSVSGIGRPNVGFATNFNAADESLKLTPQEKNLYRYHLTNLTGKGGVDNADGSRSTIYDTTATFDGRTYVLPRVAGGKILSDEDAVARAKKIGLDKFPSYDSVDAAEARYNQIHGFMEKDTAAYMAAKSKPARPELNLNDTKRASVAAITNAANDANFPPDVAVAVSILESSLNPAARATPTGRNPHPTAMGLFQFRDKERAQYGIGADADADTQAKAGVQLLKDRAAELQQRGIEVTPVTLYMAHFQGVGGAVAILKSEPGARVAEVLDRATNRRGYGATVLDANSLPADMTAGQFVRRIAGRVNGAMIAAQSPEAGFPEREALVRRTETKIRQAAYDRQHADAAAAQQTQHAIEADVASISGTGKENAELSYEQVRDRLGEGKAVAWQQARERARLYYTTTRDFETIPSAEIESRLAQMASDKEAAAGTDRYDDMGEMLDRATKRADSVLKLRQADPARAVEAEPGVQEALKMLNPAMPQTVQNLVGARIAAQERAGIPAAGVRPITNREAREINQTITDAYTLTGKDRKLAIMRAVTDIGARYGEFGEQVLTQVLRDQTQDDAAAKQLAGAFNLVANGIAPTPPEQRKTQQEAELSLIQRAINGTTQFASGLIAREVNKHRAAQGLPPLPEPQASAPPPHVAAGPTKAAADPSKSELENLKASFTFTRPPTRDDWSALVLGGISDQDFDRRYGQGAAAVVHRSVELVTNPAARAAAKGKPNG